MAITICSSANHSPTLPTVSLPSIPTISSIKPPLSLQPPFTLSSTSSASSKICTGLVSDNSLVIALTAAEALALATTAADAARDATSSAKATGEVSYAKERVSGLERDKESGVEMRRKKRRKRRQEPEDLELEEIGNGEGEEVLVMSAKCRYLSLREESDLALCFKESARLESIRSRISESGEPELALNQWAKAAGLKQRNLDRKLCKGRESRERICRIYKRLVVSIANGYQGKGLSLQDLIQEGSIGLLRGVEKFDPERRYKLSTYVYWWIRQAISRAIDNNSRVVRLPGSMCEMLAKIAEANNALSKKYCRLATFDEIAEELNVKVSTVRLVSVRSRPPISLDAAAINRGSMTLQEIIPGPDDTMPETMVKKQLKKQVVEKLLETLNEREAKIVRLYFGLDGDTPRSCEEIGRVVKLSRERVRQINSIALSKLRQKSIADNLKMYML